MRPASARRRENLPDVRAEIPDRATGAPRSSHVPCRMVRPRLPAVLKTVKPENAIMTHAEEEAAEGRRAGVTIGRTVRVSARRIRVNSHVMVMREDVPAIRINLQTRSRPWERTN